MINEGRHGRRGDESADDAASKQAMHLVGLCVWVGGRRRRRPARWMDCHTTILCILCIPCTYSACLSRMLSAPWPSPSPWPSNTVACPRHSNVDRRGANQAVYPPKRHRRPLSAMHPRQHHQPALDPPLAGTSLIMGRLCLLTLTPPPLQLLMLTTHW